MKKILYFNASWCGPCRNLKPIVESLSSQLNIQSIDIDQNQQLAQEYGIRSIPALVFEKDGRIIEKKMGVLSESQIRETWTNL
jgi:thioredoxin-like negative regulator of GroEL